jgi:NADPH:quinone reductase-like Zn-dependent oxidoreductase
MRAVQHDRFGPPEVLTLVEVETPEPAATQVLVRVLAAGVNPIDWKTRRGEGLGRSADLPFIPG